MLIIVTGNTGTGKTTVCEKVLRIAKNLGYSCGGVITNKAEDSSILIEDVRSGDREELASTKNIYQGPRTGKYSFTPAGIEFGTKAINRGISCDILFIDEIGHLELRGEGFTQTLELVRADSSKNCILVIRSALLPAFLPQLPKTPLIFQTTTSNRDELPQEIGLILSKELNCADRQR